MAASKKQSLAARIRNLRNIPIREFKREQEAIAQEVSEIEALIVELARRYENGTK